MWQLLVIFKHLLGPEREIVFIYKYPLNRMFVNIFMKVCDKNWSENYFVVSIAFAMLWTAVKYLIHTYPVADIFRNNCQSIFCYYLWDEYYLWRKRVISCSFDLDVAFKIFYFGHYLSLFVFILDMYCNYLCWTVWI